MRPRRAREQVDETHPGEGCQPPGLYAPPRRGGQRLQRAVRTLAGWGRVGKFVGRRRILLWIRNFCSVYVLARWAHFWHSAKKRPTDYYMRNRSFAELRQLTGLSVEQAANELGYCPSTVYRWERGDSAPKTSVYRVMEVLVQFSADLPAAKQNGGLHFRFIDLFAGIGESKHGFEPLTWRTSQRSV